MFPIFDYKGNVIGFGGRVLDDSLPKYLNSEDTIIFNKRYNLYGLNFARKHIGNSRTLILVEGYMDLISMYQYGVKNVVATLGTALTDAQGQLIKKFADNVVLSYDSDQAGINASLRAINILEKCNLKAKVLDLGKSKDPDEFVRANGLDEMLKKVENASDALKFRLDTLYSSHDQSNPEETVEFLQKAVNILSYIKSPIELDFYIKYLSELTKTAPEVIRSELNLTGKRKTLKEKFKKQEFVKIKKEKDVEDGNIFIERNLIKAMMVSKKAREIIPLKVGIDQIIDESDKKVYSKVLASNKMGMIRIEDLNDTSLDVDYLRKLDAVDLSEINLDDVHEINKIVNQLLKLNSKEKINKLSKRQKVLEDRRKTIEDNTEEAKEVDLEIMKIALEIVSENKKLKSF